MSDHVREKSERSQESAVTTYVDAKVTHVLVGSEDGSKEQQGIRPGLRAEHVGWGRR